ncbi:LPD38 domain-containing protein [Gayadomonas joobiniege]|uniref:LPD38 domain-containing protein n=1 Tax=Gayadomonas joobiniege TaxID=1234606 RepID=UPI000370F95E|nr:LPD38 domain-containing protein [Gayadomonas joobiniege]
MPINKDLATQAFDETESQIQRRKELEADKNTSYGGDMVDAFQMGALQAAGGLANLVDDDWGKSLNDWANEQRLTMTDESQKALQGETLKDMGLRGVGLHTASAIGQLGATLPAGGLVGKVGVKALSKLGAIKKGTDGVGYANKASEITAKGTQVGSMGLVGGGSATGMSGNAGRERVLNTDIETLANSEAFQAIFNEVDIDPEYRSLPDHTKLEIAKRELADVVDKELVTDPTLWAVNVGMSAVGDSIIGNILKGQTRNIGKNFATGFAAEAPTEAIQGGVDHYVSQSTMRDYVDKTIDPTEGLANAMITEGVIGGLAGGGIKSSTGLFNKPNAANGDSVDMLDEDNSESATASGELSQEQINNINNDLSNKDFDIQIYARNQGVNSRYALSGLGDDLANNNIRPNNVPAVIDAVELAGQDGGDFPRRDISTIDGESATGFGVAPYVYDGEYIESDTPTQYASERSGLLGRGFEINDAEYYEQQGLPDKTTGVIYGQDERPMQQAQENADRIRQKPLAIEDKNIVFSENGLKWVGRSDGTPHKTLKALKITKPYRDAVKAGFNPIIEKTRGGYLWAMNGGDSSDTNLPDTNRNSGIKQGWLDNNRGNGNHVPTVREPKQPAKGLSIPKRNTSAGTENLSLGSRSSGNDKELTIDDAELTSNDNITGIKTSLASVNELSLSDDIPQFKSGSDSEGVVEPLTGEFDPIGMSPIQVWVRNDGSKEIITGRHRFDLAKRSGVKHIPAQYHYEDRGFTAEDGKRLDAILNIREDKGQVEDYVELFRQDNVTESEAKRYGLLDRSIGRRAYTIANSATTETIEAQRSGRISAAAAETIAQAAPNDDRLQTLGVKAVADDQRSITFAKNLIQAVSTLKRETGSNPEMDDLFGFDGSGIREAEEMAKVASGKQREAKKRLNTIRGAAKNPKVAKEEGIDIKDAEALKARINELSDTAKAWDKWHTNPDLVSQIKTEMNGSEQARTQETSAVTDDGATTDSEQNNSLFREESLPPKQEKPSKLDKAEEALNKQLQGLFGELKEAFNEQKGTLNSGIDPKIAFIVSKIGAVLAAKGVVKFAQWAKQLAKLSKLNGIQHEQIKPYLKSSYGAITSDPERYGLSYDVADNMDLPSQVRSQDIDKILENNNVSTAGKNLEQNSPGRHQGSEHKNNDDVQSNGTEPNSRRTEPTLKKVLRSDSELGVSADDGTLSRARGSDDILNERGNVTGAPNSGSARKSRRGNRDNDTGTQTQREPTAAVEGVTNSLILNTKKSAQRATKLTKWGDSKDIKSSVPILMPAQADDVALIESRFFGKSNPGVGFQNTNGTGTGKTFVGLGLIKRFSQNDKNNSLVLVPNDGIAQQWVKAAKEFFDLDIYLIGQAGLPKTKDPGKGITIATYATLGNNNALIKDREKFELIVADESQNLMGNQQAKETNALKQLRAITNHERGTYTRARAVLSDKIDALNARIDKKYSELLPMRDNAQAAKDEAREYYSKELTALESEIRALGEKFSKQGQFDTKVLFLSATPWPYAKNLDYSEGYLFKYTDFGDKHDGGYDNAFHGHNAFYIQNFGYRWRYHKLNKPGPDVDESLMERTFNQNMKDKGVVGGRTLEVDADYRRDFIKVETAAGEKLDDLIEKWRDHEQTKDGSEYPERPYSDLADELNRAFDYTSKIKLTEAIKAEEAASRALDHIAMGRKVVLFHSYNVGGSFNPIEKVRQAKPDLMARFDAEFPGMSEIDFGYLKRPLDVFADAFGDQVRFYNGTVSDKERKLAKDLFNEDDSGVNVIVVQQEAGEAGISLHDVTGKHQRVLINIGMPVKPTQFIQIEGRTYRVGVKTNAHFENLTTGTAFERSVFANKIAGRASTAENLAMGEFARSLKENISEGYLDASYKPAQIKIGIGGKAKDKPSIIDEWDKAISLYYSNLKRTSSTKSAEGTDYFATPEPLGKKMVEWLQAIPGHRLLEPSVGHAAIGRWFPGTTRNRATEKSFKLTSLAQMNFPGEVDNIAFEDLNTINKFDGVVMNPPFGRGGKLAYDHITKALKHLVNGGRVVSLVPDGPSANKRLNTLLEDDKFENIYQAAEIDLPAGVFERAGTGVKTKIIVLDRFDNPDDAPTTQYVNFSGVKDVKHLFERIKDVEIKERKRPTIDQVDASIYMDTESPVSKNRKGEDQFKIELYGYLPAEVKKIIDTEAIEVFGARPSRDEKIYYVDHPEARGDLAQFIGRTIEEAKESGIEFNFKPPIKKTKIEGEQSNKHFSFSGEKYTTKKGKEFFVSEMRNRQDYDSYKALQELAKEYRGWSRGQKFMFATEDDLTQFNAYAKKFLETKTKFNLETNTRPKGVNLKAAKIALNRFITKYAGLSDINVVVTDESQDKYFEGVPQLIKGAFTADTNTMYLFVQNHDSMDDLRATIQEELIVHKGLDGLTGAKRDEILLAIHDTRKSKSKSITELWAEVDRLYDGYPLDIRAEEFLAKIAHKKLNVIDKYFNKLLSLVHKALVKMGLATNRMTRADMRLVVYRIGNGLKANRSDNSSGKPIKFNLSDGSKPLNLKNQSASSNPIKKHNILFNRSEKEIKVKGVTESEAKAEFTKFNAEFKGLDDEGFEQFITSKKPSELFGPEIAADDNFIKGAFDKNTNRLFVFASNHQSIEDLRRTLREELLIHKGLGVFSEKEISELLYRINSTRDSKDENIQKIWEDVNRNYADKGPIVQAEEFLGKVSQKKIHIPAKYWDRIISAFQKLLRKFGLVKDQITMAEMRVVVSQISAKLQSGKKATNYKYDAEKAVDSDGTRFNRADVLSDALDKLGLGEAEVTSLLDRVKEKWSSFSFSNAKERAKEGVFDSLYGIKKAEDAVGIKTEDSGYVSARLATGIGDTMNAVMFYGAPVWKNGVVARKEGTKGLLEVLGMLDQKQLNHWLAWMAGNRADKLMEEGRENNLTQAEIDELKALNKGNEALFNQVKAEYNKINSATLDLAEEAGLIAPDVRKNYDEEWYVPFFRESEEGDLDAVLSGPLPRSGIANQSGNIQALRGGEQATKDILSNILQRQATLIEASMKNKAMREVAENLNGTEFMQEVALDKFQKDAERKARRQGRSEFVEVRNNGSDTWYRISDPALMRALMQLNIKRTDNPLMKLSRAAKRFLTTGVTLSPDFIVRNFIRDSVHGWMINKDEFKFGKDSYIGMKQTWAKDESTLDLMFAGASFQGGYVHANDPEQAAQQIRRALRKKGLSKSEIDNYLGTIPKNMGEFFEKYRSFSDAMENANRASTYRRAKEAGKSDKVAAFEAKDFMDFSLQGNFKAMQFFVDVLPFFNARMQGLYKLYRAGKAQGDDKLLKVFSKELAMKGSKVAAFSLGLMLLNMDDERYEELPDWDKDANWHFFLGDTHIRLPKPFELGIVFGTVPERMFNFAVGKQNGEDVKRSAVHALVTTMAINPIPQLILPGVESYMNYQIFGGRPIEGFGDQFKRPQDRYSNYTTETAKAMGELFGYSPKKIEHLVQGYAGTLGMYVLGASDMLANSVAVLTGNGEFKVNELDDIRFVRSFIKHGEVGSSYYRERFYELLKDVNAANNQYKTALQERDVEAAKDILEDNKHNFKFRARVNKAHAQMNKLSQQINLLHKAKWMPLKQREKEIDKLSKMRNALAKKVIIEHRYSDE